MNQWFMKEIKDADRYQICMAIRCRQNAIRMTKQDCADSFIAKLALEFSVMSISVIIVLNRTKC